MQLAIWLASFDYSMCNLVRRGIVLMIRKADSSRGFCSRGFSVMHFLKTVTRWYSGTCNTFECHLNINRMVEKWILLCSRSGQPGSYPEFSCFQLAQLKIEREASKILLSAHNAHFWTRAIQALAFMVSFPGLRFHRKVFLMVAIRLGSDCERIVMGKDDNKATAWVWSRSEL